MLARAELGYRGVFHGLGTTSSLAASWCRISLRRASSGEEGGIDASIGHNEAVTDAQGFLLSEEMVKVWPDAKVCLETEGLSSFSFRGSVRRGVLVSFVSSFRVVSVASGSQAS